MATFKVGQRVKYKSGILPQVPIDSVGTVRNTAQLLAEGTVGLEVDFAPFWGGDGTTLFYVRYSSVVPLTDPKADEFIESIKKLKPLHEEPKVPQRVKTSH